MSESTAAEKEGTSDHPEESRTKLSQETIKEPEGQDTVSASPAPSEVKDETPKDAAETEALPPTEEGKKAEAPSQDFAAYEEHMTYAADGGAIYTDPSTKQKYKWCNTENNWIPLSADEAAKAGDLYENEHYKWCPKTEQWLPKTQETETEHYKWDEKQQKWLPKQQKPGQDVVYLDEQGERTYTDKDGSVFFWDTSKGAWFPKIDDDFMARYQMNYGFIDNTSAGEKEKAEKEAAEAKRKAEELKRMTAEAEAAMAKGSAESVTVAPTGKRKAQEPPSKFSLSKIGVPVTRECFLFIEWFEMDPSQNTKVYVSNLPLDITIDEFAELMGKCGMVMRDPQTQKFKLKLYAEKDGQIKGDGLCDYIKVGAEWKLIFVCSFSVY